MTRDATVEAPIELEWRARDAAGLVRALRSTFARTEVAPDGTATVWWPGLCLSVRLDREARHDRLVVGASSERAGVAVGEHERDRPQVALGWATVDAERAMRDAPGVAYEPAPPDLALGARAWRASQPGVELVLLEAATEGRLAAALARHGEGPVALYAEAIAPVDPAAVLGPTASPVGERASLVRPREACGPFLFLVEGALTSARGGRAPRA